MSNKSTIFSAPCCHIYESYLADDLGFYDIKRPILCIEVSYGDIDDQHNECNYIQVEADSDFAKLIREKFNVAG